MKQLNRNWQEGSMRVGKTIYHFWAKQYPEGSQYGIRGGRVSKLTIKRKDEIVCNYDRGWDIKPVDEEAETAMEIVLLMYAG